MFLYVKEQVQFFTIFGQNLLFYNIGECLKVFSIDPDSFLIHFMPLVSF